jgi:hypothetical protein
MLGLGYSTEDMKDAFDVELAKWVRQRQSPVASLPTRIAEPKATLARQKG